MQQFYEEHPEYSRPLLTFALEYITAKKWPSNTLMHEHNTCDEVCELGQECGCTCLIDPFSMDDDEVRRLVRIFSLIMCRASRRCGRTVAFL